MTLTAPTPIETTAKSPLGDAVPITRKPFVPSPLNRRRWAEFLGQPARLLVVLDLHDPVHGVDVCRADRQ